MAKISYKGMELEEFVSDKPEAFQKGTKVICWNGDDFEKSCKAEHELIAFIPYIRSQVLTLPPDGGVLTFWDHCAIIKVIKAQEETSEEHKGENLVLSEIHFQEGPIKECGVNGVMNEDLLVMVVRRLEGFQNSEFKCRENAMAITKLEEALLWLHKRTMGRENRGVEGTHTV